MAKEKQRHCTYCGEVICVRLGLFYSDAYCCNCGSTIRGELNKSLNLEETKGWYECSKCGSVMQVAGYDLGCVRIPIIEWKDLPKLAHKV